MMLLIKIFANSCHDVDAFRPSMQARRQEEGGGVEVWCWWLLKSITAA